MSSRPPAPPRPQLPALKEPPRGTLAWLHAHQPAVEDYNRVDPWLRVFEDRSPNTLRAYQNEVLRWRMFLQFRRGHPSPTLIAFATEGDAEAYVRALGWRPSQEQYPDELFEPLLLPASLLATFEQQHQPFVRAKSPRTIKLAVAILAAMYSFLGRTHGPNETPYVRHNPFGRLARMQDRSISKTDRYFTPEIYLAMRATAARVAEEAKDPEERRRAQRAIWAMSLLFQTWLRISEACSITMASFVFHKPMWILKVRGKGRKVRDIAISASTMADLRVYREQNGLPGLPAGEAIPALLHVRRRPARASPHVDPDTIYRDIKWIVDLTATRLGTAASASGEPSADEQLLLRIRSISPHWFRHSGGSEALNSGFPLQDAAVRLGHASTAITTQMYYHGDHTKQADLLDEIAARRGLPEPPPKA